MKRLLRALPLFAVFTFLISCSGRINGQLVIDGSASLQVQASLEANMIALVKSLGDLSGGSGPGGTLLDAAAINRSLRAAPGIASSSLRNSGQEKIEGAIAVSRIGDLLNARANRFVTYQPPAGTVPGRLAIHLNRSTAPHLLMQLAPEAVDYISALMAPAATGEVLTKADYLELVSSVYGKELADEIAASRITAAITFPGAVKTVKGGTPSGREARFNIPLIDLLVLEKPLDYEVVW